MEKNRAHHFIYIEINIFRLLKKKKKIALPPDSLAVCGTPQFSYVCNNKFLILPR